LPPERDAPRMDPGRYWARARGAPRRGVARTSLFLAFLLGITLALLVLAVTDIQWPPRRRRRCGPPVP